MLALQPDAVHVWTLDLSVPRDKEWLEGCHALLSDAERTRMARYAREDLQQKYLLTRAMMRSCLSHYAGLAAEDWQFDTDAHGKPYLLNSPIPLSFNLSHSGERAVFVVAHQIPVGIDVEQASRKSNFLGIAEHFFHPDEAEQLKTLPAAEQQELFFQWWTLKEAYLKARGTGIATGLEKVCFYRSHTAIKARFAPELMDDANAWRFCNYRLDNNYYLALAVKPSVAEQLEVIFYESWPLSTQAPQRLADDALPTLLLR